MATVVANGHYQLEAEVSKLGEVVVTAQESRGLTSSSRIEKHAMEHLQPSSFSDLLELLPGGSSKEPVLNAANNIRLREASPQGTNYATSSLGTSFLMDGARITTNANMQQVSGAWESAATSRDNTNAGVDMRTISTDDIESVEIIRGIPSVEYGVLTSGLVKIERRRGGHDLQARLKSDMGSKLFYLAKAFEWDHRTTLNLSADYLDSKADPRNLLNNYSRVTLVLPFLDSIFLDSLHSYASLLVLANTPKCLLSTSYFLIQLISTCCNSNIITLIRHYAVSTIVPISYLVPMPT